MSAETRSRFMMIIAIIFTLYSLLWGLAPYESVNLPARFILDVSDWPFDKTMVALDRNTQWLSSISAGLLLAISIILAGIVAPAIKAENQSIIRTTIVAFIAWYLVDSIGSVAAGVPSNAFFNTIYLVLVLIPLWGGCRKW
jgi:hypothetical protein